MRWIVMAAMLASPACGGMRFGAPISAKPGGDRTASSSVSGKLGDLSVAVQ